MSVLFGERSTNPTSAPTPNTGRLLDVLNLLWIETSHAFIHRHRQRVANVDRELKNGPSGKSGQNGSGSRPPGPTARRKLVHALRSFLASEETFWAGLLSRIVESYHARDAEPAIRALSIAMTPFDSTQRESDPEDDLGDPREAFGRQQGLLLCHRALICFGDLMRYRELYSESAAKASKTSMGRASQTALNRHTYARAAECYHQARLLVPDDGQCFGPSCSLSGLISFQCRQPFKSTGRLGILYT